MFPFVYRGIVNKRDSIWHVNLVFFSSSDHSSEVATTARNKFASGARADTELSSNVDIRGRLSLCDAMRVQENVRKSHSIVQEMNYNEEETVVNKRSKCVSKLSPQETLFVCEMCDKTFTQKIGLTRHVDVVHLKLRPFSCEMCDKSFP